MEGRDQGEFAITLLSSGVESQVGAEKGKAGDLHHQGVLCEIPAAYSNGDVDVQEADAEQGQTDGQVDHGSAQNRAADHAVYRSASSALTVDPALRGSAPPVADDVPTPLASPSKKDTPRSKWRIAARAASFATSVRRNIAAEEVAALPDGEVSAQTVWNCGSTGHASRHFSVGVTGSSWKVSPGDFQSGSSASKASAQFAVGKIAAAAAFIESLPHFNAEEVFLHAREREQGSAYQRQKLVADRRRKYESGDFSAAAHDPEPNRLESSLTEGTVRECCDAMYDLFGRGKPSRDTESGEVESDEFVAGGVEAALIAWDLASEIQGAWRVPLTIVSHRGDRSFSYVCVLVVLGARVAALGRSVLGELCHSPLARQRVSDIVDRYAKILEYYGHKIHTVYLGLPTDAPNKGKGFMDQPVHWRYLKLSAARQSWQSVLASCDAYVGQRAVLRRYACGPRAGTRGGAGPPKGFKALGFDEGRHRLKVTAPLLTRNRRERKRRPLPPLGSASEAESDGPDGPLVCDGVWQLSVEEMRRAQYGGYGAACTSGGSLEAELTDCSSVSDASLEEHAEDRAMAYVPPPTTPSKVAVAKQPVTRREASKFGSRPLV